MPKARQFDRTQALERAMRLFWRHGYAATSIQDVVEATGVNRASLYATFGDKRGLFLAALDHYLSQVSAARLAALAADVPAREALQRHFDELIAFAARDGRGLGCLLTNTTIELAPHDAGVADTLKSSFARVEAAFAEVIRRGQAEGEIPPGKDPQALARFLLATVQGLRVLMRAEADASELHDVVTTALGALDGDTLHAGTSVPDKRQRTQYGRQP